MGRIDSEKFYNIATNWYWGNSGDPDIYHDTETRRNGITYRGNLARLTEKLIEEEQYDKAKDILDLAMEKMPVDIFEYYTLLEPFISGYYEVGEQAKARELWQQVAGKYQEKLDYWSTLSLERQYQYAQDIITDIERYRSLVDLLIINQDQEIIPEKAREFNSYLRKFNQFYGEDETEPESVESMLPNEPTGDSSVAIPAATDSLQ